MKRQIFYLILALFSHTSLFSQQSTSKFNTFSVGADFSSNVFLGDIKQYGFYPSRLGNFNEFRFSGAVNAKKTINNLYAIRGEIGTGKLAGIRRQFGSCEECYTNYDMSLDSISTKFLAKYINFDAAVVLNLSNLIINKHISTAKFNVFGEVGAGLISFNSVLRRTQNGAVMAYRGYESMALENKSSQTEAYLKLGATLLYQLNKRIDLSGKVKYYLVNSDKIDAVDASGRDLAGVDNDRFLSFSLGVSYNIGSKNKSLHWHNPLNDLHSNQNQILKKIRKLSKDNDDDGVANIFDKHEETPEGVVVDGSGVPLDVDRDGVYDYEDNDLFSSKNASVNSSGVESDKDGDGVPDSEDMEVSEKGSLVNYKGITIGSSKSANASSMPAIHFATASTKIRKDDFMKLAEVALIMQDNATDKYMVVGHADKRGATDFNQQLAEKRAQTVARYLIDIFDIDANRLTILSKGESSPVVDDSKGSNNKEYNSMVNYLNEMNRRVEFIKQ